MAICESCPLIDREGDKCFLPGTQPCCGECGCKLGFKTRSLSSECPHPDGPLWHALLEEDDEDEVYEEIGYENED